MKLFTRALQLLPLAFVASSFGLAAAAQAATLSPGTLIKGPIDTVYYYATNGKRLVFPNVKTYNTWYKDFSGVVTVTADDLAAIPLGGNVTYRPGVKLVKVTTDPKVYAVAANGLLRWVTTESLATQLYGSDWNTKVDDVPDAYFTNYVVGAPIASASDYSPSAQTATAVDIDTDKGLEHTPSPTPTPTPTSTPSTTSTPVVSDLSFSVSKTTVQAGDIEALTASTSDTTPISNIQLYFDGVLLKTCTINSCYAETPVPSSGTKDSYVAEARLTKLDNSTVTQDITVPVTVDGSSLVQLHIGQAVITPNQSASAVVDADASLAVNHIDIYVDGVDVKGCATGSRQCQWSDYLQGGVSSTHSVYGKITDSLGRTYTSRTLTITIGTDDTPAVTVSPAKTTIYAGETVDVTVTASDNEGIASMDVMKDGAVLKHCTGAVPCTVTTGPWPTAGTTLTFTGRAFDMNSTEGDADPVTVSVVAQP